MACGVGSGSVRGWVVGGCAGSVQKCALEAGFHPGELSEGVCGWMVGGCAGSVQKCALEAGFHPGDWFECGLEPRVTKTLQFTLCLYISASVLLQNLVFYSILWGWRARGCGVGGRAGSVPSERLRPDFARGDGVGGCARMDGRRVRGKRPKMRA